MPSWKPGEKDKDIPLPPLTCCTDSFRDMLSRHLVETTKKVELDVKGMKERTTSLRDLKARAYADLHRWETTKTKVLDEIGTLKSMGGTNKIKKNKTEGKKEKKGGDTNLA